MRVGGLHHVTAMASSPQRNLDFYAGVLGLRLVKKTVNFDDPGTYHFYFGDEAGRPGTLLTFFPWPMARRGTAGRGETRVVSLGVAEGSLGRWLERLDRHGVDREDPRPRFGRDTVRLRDPDGMTLELVEGSGKEGLRFAGVTLQVRDLDPTSELLSAAPFALEVVAEDGDRRRFVSADGEMIDLVAAPLAELPRLGAGSIHHIAWRAEDGEAQLTFRRQLQEIGLGVTPVQDRRYFESIYFREPGGVLFEIATDGPGFDRDEALSDLGRELKLPPWLEADRDRIEKLLPAVEQPAVTAGEAS